MGSLSATSWIRSNRVLALLAVGIAFAAVCFRLGHLPLLAPDEGRNAEVGREMQQSGAWLVPTYNGVAYLDKPAIYFKAVALSLAVFGNNETAARLPSVVFGLALLALVFLFCRKVHETQCGLLAVMVVATIPLFLANARTVIFDIPLAFFVSGAIFAGYLAEETDGKIRRNWYLAGAVSAGMATLVKGPVGFLVPALVLSVFNRVEGRKGTWRRMLAPLNLAVFFGITLPWFVGLCLAHRDFLHYGLVEESFNRFTIAKKFHRSEPVYFFPLIILATFFPWSLLLPEASLAAWKGRWAKHSADRLCLVWSVVVTVFFSCSQSKLPGYILSVTVACGILLARLFTAAMAEPEGQAARLVQRAVTTFSVLCFLAALAFAGGAWQWPSLVKLLRIPQADAALLRNTTVPMAVVLTGFGVFGLTGRYRRNAMLCFLCLALFPPWCVLANVGALETVFNAKSGRRLADQLANLPPQTELAFLECYPNGLPFYLRHTGTLITRDGGELTSHYIVATLEKSKQWPAQIVPFSQFDRWLATRKTPVYLIAKQEAHAELESLAAPRSTTVQTLSPRYLGVQLPTPVQR